MEKEQLKHGDCIIANFEGKTYVGWVKKTEWVYLRFLGIDDDGFLFFKNLVELDNYKIINTQL